MKNFHILLIISLLSFGSCKKDPNFNPNDKGKIKIKLFNNLYNEKVKFLQSSGNFNVSKLQYYLSNFKFIKPDGKEYVYPKDKSYFLIEEQFNQTPFEFIFEDIPVGDYVGLSFVIGIDSLKCAAPIEQRIGILDPSNNEMYWSLNEGYIFLKIEGYSKLIPVNLNKGYRFHIGGYGGYTSPTINNLRTVKLSFQAEVAQVRKNSTPNIIMGTEISNIFNGDISKNIVTNSDIMFTPYSLKVSENYAGMFSYGYLYME